MSITNQIKIAIADDHKIFRDGIKMALSGKENLKMLWEAEDGKDMMHKISIKKPQVLLMDIRMPEMSGIECIIAIRSDFPNARIIVLTTYPGDVQVLRALKAGARGYLLKGQVNRDLPEVIRAVHSGQKRIPPEIAIELAEHTAEDDLSSREIEVLRLIAAGNANKEIANKLCIAEETVKRHVSNILAKLHANDRTHAVTTALKRGIIQL